VTTLAFLPPARAPQPFAARATCPGDRCIELVESEALHFSLGKVLRDVRNDTRQLAIGGKRNPLDLPMRVAPESHMAKHAPQVLPAGEFMAVDDDAVKLTVRFEPSVGRERQRVEVVHTQGFFELNDYDPRISLKMKGDGGAFRNRAQPLNRLLSFLIAECAIVSVQLARVL
jgi:hypothetical protein